MAPEKRLGVRRTMRRVRETNRLGGTVASPEALEASNPPLKALWAVLVGCLFPWIEW
jgi:hypothetical protein